MNITEAKKIPLALIVEKLGGRYSNTDRKGDHWYFSPFRPDEKTASFKIDEKRNTWHDFGLSSTLAHQSQGSGGDGLDLWCDYNFKDRRLGTSQALKALREFNFIPVSQIATLAVQKQVFIPKPPRYKILKIADQITLPGLKDELIRRRISLKIANLYLKQGHILDGETKKTYTGFLFENDKGGYEVSIPNPVQKTCFKTCIGPKASTLILTSSFDTNSADVFEGFWDFLSFLEFKHVQLPRHHSYILNSVSLVNEVCTKIINFKDSIKYAFVFMDYDEAGYHATHNIAAVLGDEDIEVGSFEQLYRGFKDLNDFWANSPKVKKTLF